MAQRRGTIIDKQTTTIVHHASGVMCQETTPLNLDLKLGSVPPSRAQLISVPQRAQYPLLHHMIFNQVNNLTFTAAVPALTSGLMFPGAVDLLPPLGPDRGAPPCNI